VRAIGRQPHQGCVRRPRTRHHDKRQAFSCKRQGFFPCRASRCAGSRPRFPNGARRCCGSAPRGHSSSAERCRPPGRRRPRRRITLIQRFGSAADLHIHLHCLVLGGVHRCGANGGCARRGDGPHRPGRARCRRRGGAHVKATAGKPCPVGRSALGSTPNEDGRRVRAGTRRPRRPTGLHVAARPAVALRLERGSRAPHGAPGAPGDRTRPIPLGVVRFDAALVGWLGPLDPGGRPAEWIRRRLACSSARPVLRALRGALA
jgi:hypothetical protein